MIKLTIERTTDGGYVWAEVDGEYGVAGLDGRTFTEAARIAARSAREAAKRPILRRPPCGHSRAHSYANLEPEDGPRRQCAACDFNRWAADMFTVAILEGAGALLAEFMWDDAADYEAAYTLEARIADMIECEYAAPEKGAEWPHF